MEGAGWLPSWIQVKEWETNWCRCHLHSSTWCRYWMYVQRESQYTKLLLVSQETLAGQSKTTMLQVNCLIKPVFLMMLYKRADCWMWGWLAVPSVLCLENALKLPCYCCSTEKLMNTKPIQVRHKACIDRSRVFYLQHLCKQCNIVFVQEHRLASFNMLDILHMCSDMCSLVLLWMMWQPKLPKAKETEIANVVSGDDMFKRECDSWSPVGCPTKKQNKNALLSFKENVCLKQSERKNLSSKHCRIKKTMSIVWTCCDSHAKAFTFTSTQMESRWG